MHRFFAPALLTALAIGVGFYNATADNRVLAFYGFDQIFGDMATQGHASVAVLGALAAVSTLVTVWRARSDRPVGGDDSTS